MCVWMRVLCECTPMLLCTVYVTVCNLAALVKHNSPKCHSLAANVSYGWTATFIHCVWHHLPFRHINDYFTLSSSQGNTLACDRAQQHTRTDFPQETVACRGSVASCQANKCQVSNKHLEDFTLCLLMLACYHTCHKASHPCQLKIGFTSLTLHKEPPQNKQGV